jgi:uncharacterized protein (DUF58 family)
VLSKSSKREMTPFKALLFLFSALLFLALNTGNNFAYLLVSIVLVGWWMYKRDVKSLRGRIVCQRNLPERFVAQSEEFVTIDVTNLSHKTPLIQLQFDCYRGSLPEIKVNLDWLAPGATVSFTEKFLFEKRGIYPMPTLSIKRRTLFETSLRFNCTLDDVAVVHPDQSLTLPELLQMLGEKAGKKLSEIIGLEDFQGIHRGREGVSPTRIHWKNYSRTGQIFVKKFTETRNEHVLILLAAGSDIERAVRVTASLSTRLIERGITHQLLSWSENFRHIPVDSTNCQILDHLAVIGVAKSPPLPQRLRQSIKETACKTIVVIATVTWIEEIDEGLQNLPIKSLFLPLEDEEVVDLS